MMLERLAMYQVFHGWGRPRFLAHTNTRRGYPVTFLTVPSYCIWRL